MFYGISITQKSGMVVTPAAGKKNKGLLREA